MHTHARHAWRKKSLHACKSMTTKDIKFHMKELYDMDISNSTINRITVKKLLIVREWQEHPLERSPCNGIHTIMSVTKRKL